MLSSGLRSPRAVQVNIEIRHAQDAGVHRGGVLDFEGAGDRSALEPEDVDVFDRLEGGVVVVEREVVRSSGLDVGGIAEDGGAVGSGGSKCGGSSGH